MAKAQQQALGGKDTDHGRSAIAKRKTDSNTAFFSNGGSMATKKVNPFAKFEKSSKDKDTKAVFKKFGKEGSKKEEAFDKKQAKGMKCGGKTK